MCNTAGAILKIKLVVPGYNDGPKHLVPSPCILARSVICFKQQETELMLHWLQVYALSGLHASGLGPR